MTERQRKVWQAILGFIMALVGVVAGDVSNINFLN